MKKPKETKEVKENHKLPIVPLNPKGAKK